MAALRENACIRVSAVYCSSSFLSLSCIYSYSYSYISFVARISSCYTLQNCHIRIVQSTLLFALLFNLYTTHKQPTYLPPKSPASQPASHHAIHRLFSLRRRCLRLALYLALALLVHLLRLLRLVHGPTGSHEPGRPLRHQPGASKHARLDERRRCGPPSGRPRRPLPRQLLVLLRVRHRAHEHVAVQGLHRLLPRPLRRVLDQVDRLPVGRVVELEDGCLGGGWRVDGMVSSTVGAWRVNE
ncbi:hypothetical protein HDK64DRAFT_150573 [Phyllosticta capitalensis]|uniref:Uncharacterized protein n=1 Tax=Phyllosticta capitalensis TaxID=121624 RepID=A0ABR1YJ56_9PEZI